MSVEGRFPQTMLPGAYLRAETECDEHDEEQYSPELRDGQLAQRLGIDDERQTGTWKVDAAG